MNCFAVWIVVPAVTCDGDLVFLGVNLSFTSSSISLCSLTPQVEWRAQSGRSIEMR